MKLNLLVIRTSNPKALAAQYELLGFIFDYHQHGNGPFHYASNKDGFVFEIYPLTRSAIKADDSTRLGVEVEDLRLTMASLGGSDWKVVTEARQTEWGFSAVIQDLDGRKVELTSRPLSFIS